MLFILTSTIMLVTRLFVCVCAEKMHGTLQPLMGLYSTEYVANNLNKLCIVFIV